MYKSKNSYNQRKAITVSPSEPLAMKLLAGMMLPLTLVIVSIASIAFALSLDTIFG